jgi:radical SAM superfamily enzyme YgiQ (UPF0313 family)
MNKGKIPLFKLTRLILRELSFIQKNDRVFFSVFSTESRSWATLISILLRKWFDVKIFIGGNGIYAPGESEAESVWADYMLEHNLVDAVFMNQADETLPEAIKNNFNTSGKIYKETKVFPNLGFLPKHLTVDPYKDNRVYDSIYYREDLEHPALKDELLGIEWAFKIHSTLGCVKQCTFCDVPVIQKWVMRKAEDVVEEIKHYYTTTGSTHFFLGDSTCNGSTSEWMKLLEGVYKLQQEIETPIYWNSQFALKPANRVSEEQFELIAKTNFHPSPGMDHCSDRVLHHMRKKYTWEDMLYHIDMFAKHDIWIRDALWMIGYPTETEEDVQEYDKLFSRLRSKKHTFVSNVVNVTYMNRNSPLLDIVNIDWNDPNKWTAQNGALTQEVRMNRKKKLDTEFTSIGKLKYKFRDSYRRALR